MRKLVEKERLMKSKVGWGRGILEKEGKHCIALPHPLPTLEGQSRRPGLLPGGGGEQLNKVDDGGGQAAEEVGDRPM
jgi:hypothetical protein